MQGHKRGWDYWRLIQRGDMEVKGGGCTEIESQDRFTGLEGGRCISVRDVGEGMM